MITFTRLARLFKNCTKINADEKNVDYSLSSAFITIVVSLIILYPVMHCVIAQAYLLLRYKLQHP